jgi:catechol 2,3-dioxygenase-like lactoylglutathione lyase family enzyme
MTVSDKIHFDHVGPQFRVESVAASVEFYKQVLGFDIDYSQGSPPIYAVVFRDNVYIHLCEEGPQKAEIGPGCSFIVISEVEQLWSQIQVYAVDVVEPLRENDYGQGLRVKEFSIRDPDQNILRIGELINNL